VTINHHCEPEYADHAIIFRKTFDQSGRKWSKCGRFFTTSPKVATKRYLFDTAKPGHKIKAFNSLKAVQQEAERIIQAERQVLQKPTETTPEYNQRMRKLGLTLNQARALAQQITTAKR
jgi:hypothetical protein